jgi:hypothetical protein
VKFLYLSVESVLFGLFLADLSLTSNCSFFVFLGFFLP